ncbi:inter-alpha-trypsin inhibitor-like isoform X2 [Plodia interpunctella]|uniref:inter-alpha-trypsin inhibitor-like isoform X2 n=1 Tax=Plodia interpunctella TaxID=58824 RepID=UPI00236878AB|nr:inter-alpha-trypsin inhibitor-like isoform X2 [Plodia interpunctella]XP_053607898.1 inter-alpha-trypsin inhibitor-like isoform X2 [Plodia interpunctella]XP_053607900.1 inter-alpha-trypsin inhibitor-like isoform X2 [Plodia interpunctella]
MRCSGEWCVVSAKHIWMWDLYCRLQSAKGDCKDHMTRYYYNSDFDECHHFNYSGCNGNQNNFESHAECEQRCKGVNFLNLKEHSLPTVCHLQPDSGLCLAFIKSYYYQVDSGKCLEFTYGGCGGNLNRFATKASCEEYCSTTSDTSTETTLKPSARIDHTNIDDE